MLFFNAFPDPGDDGDRVITTFDDPLSYSGFFVCKARMVYSPQATSSAFSPFTVKVAYSTHSCSPVAAKGRFGSAPPPMRTPHWCKESGIS